MPAPSRKNAPADASWSAAKVSLRAATAEDVSAPSPALKLRQRVEERWIDDHAPAIDQRWSARRTLAFIILTCGGFWACVLFGIARLFH